MKIRPNHYFVFVIFILLALPVVQIYLYNPGVISIFHVILATLGLSILMLSLFHSIADRYPFWAKTLITVLFLLGFFIRLIYAFVYDFSGKGFGYEFFTHLSYQSLKIGFNGYFVEIISSVVIVLIVLKSVFTKLLDPLHKTPQRTLMMAGIAGILVVLFYQYLPEYKLIQGYRNYFSESIISDDVIGSRLESKNILAPLRNKDTVAPNKRNLEVKAPDKPKNVIIIYLESFSNMLSENDDYQQLTPNIDQLKANYLSFSNNYSSSSVTIEGLVNSQCGTIIDMSNGNNALTQPIGRMPALPCLGDVLKSAGYYQVYYGGAQLEFAGKGAFFKEHGYDEVWGFDEWKSANIGPMNTWGLSDNRLFDEALDKILSLQKKKQPYNLTLLTLGTHIPGFKYASCPPYQHIKSSFIDAIHCTDYLLGKFINELKKHNVLENTLLYIQGDHPVFPTHDMKKLFGHKTDDPRVLTVVVDRDIDKKNLPQHRQRSAYNLSANILDLLDIKHNAAFILGQSDIQKDKKADLKPQDLAFYSISRYSDYYLGKEIKNLNSGSHCNKKAHDGKIKLPLNSCDKKIVLNAIYRLNASYFDGVQRQSHCELGVEFTRSDVKNQMSLRWGDENLSEQFYHLGRKLKKTIPGLYLLGLDQKDQIINSYFYQHTDKNDLNQLNSYIQKSGNRFVLFGHLSTQQLSALSLPMLPPDFSQNKLIYAQNINGTIQSLMDKEHSSLPKLFYPVSCTDHRENVQELSFDRGIDEPLCEIEDWGPKSMVIGQRLNPIANDNSAFWFKTNCYGSNPIIKIDNMALKTTIREGISTAEIDDKILIRKAKNYQLFFYDEVNNITQHIGTFKAINRILSPYKVATKYLANTNEKQPLLIAHAGGGMNNKTYLNSIETLNHNYQLGHRYFELDFSFTRDKILVGIHDWEATFDDLFGIKRRGVPTHKEFMSYQMKNSLSQIDLSALKIWLDKHPDAIIVTDIRGNNIKALSQLLKAIPNADERIIPQMYHFENYKVITEMGFSKIIFTLYATQKPVYELLKFIKNNDLYAITIHPENPHYSTVVTELAHTDKFLYVHTINTLEELDAQLKKGIDGIYTDFLYSNKANFVVKQIKSKD